MGKEKWCYINSGQCSPAFNMALDECLLNWQSEKKMPPTIRFYEWEIPTLTVGYFQRVEKDINMDVVKEKNMALYVVKQVVEVYCMIKN